MPRSPKSRSSGPAAALPLLLALFLLALPAAAAPRDLEGGPSNKTDICLKDPRCHKLYMRARELSRSRKIDEALVIYHQAHELRPAPWLLLNMGRLLQRQGKLAAAVEHYRRYLASAKDDPNESARIGKAGEFLAETAAALSAQSPKPPAAPVSPTPPTPPPTESPAPDGAQLPPAETNPGVATVEPPPAGPPETPPPVVTSPPVVAPTPAPRPAWLSPTPGRAAVAPRRSRLGPGFWAGTGVTAGLAAAAVVTGGLALAGSSQLKTERYIGASPTEDILAIDSRTRGLAIGTDVLLGAAGAALVITLAVSFAPKARPRAVAASPKKEASR